MKNESDNSSQQVPFFVKFFASGFFSGYSPIVSGTVGSFVAALFFFIPSFTSPFILSGFILTFFFIGVHVSTIMEKAHGHDPSVVTIDEFVGMWLSVLFLPSTYLTFILAFFLFRILDIIKPWPARVFDRMNGGWGIMLDDVVAGIYTNIILQIVVLFLK